MNKTTAGIVLGLVSILAIGGIAFSSQNDDARTKSQTASNMPSTTGHEKTHDSTNSDGHHDKKGVAPHDDMMGAQDVKSGTVEMDIADFDFQMPNLKVKIGTTVTWTNRDSARHDVAPDTESADFVGSGKLLGKGESYSYTFQKAGNFSYNCTPHPYMKAAVQVIE